MKRSKFTHLVFQEVLSYSHANYMPSPSTPTSKQQHISVIHSMHKNAAPLYCEDEIPILLIHTELFLCIDCKNKNVSAGERIQLRVEFSNKNPAPSSISAKNIKQYSSYNDAYTANIIKARGHSRFV
jgi:hypothetical protein